MSRFALYNYQFFEVPLTEIRDKGQVYAEGAKLKVMPFAHSFHNCHRYAAREVADGGGEGE